jgi:hypothetical protein
MNSGKAYRELRAWSVRHGITIEIKDIHPHTKYHAAHITKETTFANAPFTEKEFIHRIRSVSDFNRERGRVLRRLARKQGPLFKE